VSFFRDIAEQEHLVYRLQLGSAKGSYQACAQIEQYVRAMQGGPYSKPPPELDLGRYVPACQLFVRDAYRHSREEVAPGVPLLGHLRVESDREYIAALANDRDLNVRIAVAEALGALGGKESVLVLRRMIHSTSEAAWELIKLGPLAIPTIVEVIDSGTDPYNPRRPGFPDYEKVTRAYIDHGDAAPKPLDPRVLEAVRKSMAVPKIKAHRIQYHKKLLELAEPPKSEKEAPGLEGDKSALREAPLSNSTSARRSGNWPIRIGTWPVDPDGTTIFLEWSYGKDEGATGQFPEPPGSAATSCLRGQLLKFARI